MRPVVSVRLGLGGWRSPPLPPLSMRSLSPRYQETKRFTQLPYDVRLEGRDEPRSKPSHGYRALSFFHEKVRFVKVAAVAGRVSASRRRASIRNLFGSASAGRLHEGVRPRTGAAISWSVSHTRGPNTTTQSPGPGAIGSRTPLPSCSLLRRPSLRPSCAELHAAPVCALRAL